jgi:hypothetical protein
MILYRPVGLQELALIYEGGMKAFPARLPQQPIFYPVLQLEYARQTATKQNHLEICIYLKEDCCLAMVIYAVGFERY